MRGRKIMALLGLGLLLLFMAPDANAGGRTGPAARPLAGHPAPSFTLEGTDGKSYSVGGPREKPLLLNFWASWCGPCRQEAPELEQLYSKYRDRLDIYAVNVTNSENPAQVRRFIADYSLTFPVLLDWTGEKSDLYGIRFLPTNFLIDRSGRIVAMLPPLPKEALEQKLQALIRR
jgi:thiol-disulfide isomerase/thioredoxin